MGTDVQHNETVTVILESRADNAITVRVPHTDYQLDLTLEGADGTDLAEGSRVRGTIHAQVLRIHPAKAGGMFIEPMWGHPRIIAGKVIGADLDQRRVLVDGGVRMWVTAPEGQNFDDLADGALVNFYVESGVVSRPATG